MLASLAGRTNQSIDSIIDSFPVMLAANEHSYGAKVAREIAEIGYCAAKKTRFHGVRLHFVGIRQHQNLPLPTQVWLCSAAHHDSKTFKQQHLDLSETALFSDLAFADKQLKELLHQQRTILITPQKKLKGNELSEKAKYCNRLISKLRQPIESLFNWINEKTALQTASKVRSTNGLLIHYWKNSFLHFICSFSITDSHYTSF